MTITENSNRSTLDIPVASTQAKKDAGMNMFYLTWPILIENLLRIAISSVDVFMLSAYSEKAVAAVGLINQFVFFLQLLYLMVASGANILISQNLGAGKQRYAGVVGLGSISLSLVFAAILSLVMCFSADAVLKLYDLDSEVHTYSWQFLTIYSSCSAFVALSMILSTILRTHGYSREPMYITILALVANVTGNYIAIFGPFGLPVTGVPGVACSTVFSQIIACVILVLRIRKHKDIELPLKQITKVPLAVYRKILSVGVPTAGENLSYNLGQIVIMRMVAYIGTEAMAAMVYALTLLRFVFITSISIGQGTQIKVGYLVGAGRSDDAQRKVYRYFSLGFIISLTLVIIVNIAKVPAMNLLTRNPAIHQLISILLLVGLVHEPGRNFNVIIIPALKGAGDIRFPVYMGMIFMWGIGVLFAYILGISLHWGLLGIGIALASDEWIRGLVIFLRWHRGGWRNKKLVDNSSPVLTADV